MRQGGGFGWRNAKAMQSRVDEQVNDRVRRQMLELMRRADRNPYTPDNALTKNRAVRWTHAQHRRQSALCERECIDRLRHGEQIHIVGYEVGNEVAAVPEGVRLEDGGKLPGGSKEAP